MVEHKDNPASRSPLDEIRQEAVALWRKLPNKGLFFGLLAAWIGLFQFFGNSTLGYTVTRSLFAWMDYAYGMDVNDEHGYWIPLLVLALLIWKSKELSALPNSNWWPGLLLLFLALLVHVVGYMVQQARLSIVGFYFGIWALIGMVWGWRWLKATFFPMCLFAFCVPIGTLTETITLPLRILATNITTSISHVVLGIQVIQDGTRLFDPNGAYQYEIAAACSGIRSLTATMVMAIIYAFVFFKSSWRRAIIIAAAFPVAVAANVIRLSTIIIAAEAFGREAGNYVHESSLMSLLPYIPALLGLVALGYWIREDKAEAPTAGFVTARQNA